MWRDDAYLLDMLIAARRAIGYTDGVTWSEFEQDDLRQNAMMRMLEVLGEAARRVSDDTKDVHPEIPWRDLIGLRNRLIHEYFRVRVDKVWDTIQDDLPGLIAKLEPIVPKR